MNKVVLGGCHFVRVFMHEVEGPGQRGRRVSSFV